MWTLVMDRLQNYVAWMQYCSPSKATTTDSQHLATLHLPIDADALPFQQLIDHPRGSYSLSWSVVKRSEAIHESSWNEGGTSSQQIQHLKLIHWMVNGKI